MPRHGERDAFLHFLLRRQEPQVGAIALRRGGQVDRRVGERNLRLGQADKLHRLLRRDRHDQRLRIGHADVFARADDDPPRDEADVFARVEHLRQPVERRIGIAAAHRFDEGGDRIVVLVAVAIIDHRLFLDALLRDRAR